MRACLFVFLLIFAPVSVAAQARVEHAYGDDPKQALDLYLPADPESAPIIVMMHGGFWSKGDKAHGGVWRRKVGYWRPRGYAFVSVNTRLLPQADPLEQTHDLAAALAYVQQHAADWGADPDRLVLMGHSAGGHVAALLSTRQDLQAQAGVRPWAGTVLLDPPTMDIAAAMKAGPTKTVREVFDDPSLWGPASPALYLDASDPPVLVICASARQKSCGYAEDFSTRARTVGVPVTVVPIAMKHAEISTQLGLPGPLTEAVDGWIGALWE